jgi:hypothetical protein
MISHVDGVSSGVIGGSAALGGLMASAALPTAFGGINVLQCAARERTALGRRRKMIAKVAASPHKNHASQRMLDPKLRLNRQNVCGRASGAAMRDTWTHV